MKGGVVVGEPWGVVGPDGAVVLRRLTYSAAWLAMREEDRPEGTEVKYVGPE